MSTLLLISAMVAIFAAITLLVMVLGGWKQPDDTDAGRLLRRIRGVSIDPRQTAEKLVTSSGSAVSRGARGAAERLTAQGDIDATLSRKLQAAGLQWAPAEWVMLHVAVTIVAGLVMTLLTGFNIFATVLGLALGAAGPFIYLSVKENRRRAAFQSGLADVLQLMAGSLTAGYSLLQALDAVARESEGPIAEELDRALLQARIGMPLEDALETIADRMRSVDFAWVVMAIRVQREIGGNLSEVLLNVAATLRERDRIKRQVGVLSAEGRLSAWVLGGLPVVFAIYLFLTQPQYIGVLFTTPLGIMMVVVGLLIFLAGVFWLSKTVKVEV